MDGEALAQGNNDDLLQGLPADPGETFNPGRSFAAGLRPTDAYGVSTARAQVQSGGQANADPESAGGGACPPGAPAPLPTPFILHHEIGRGGFGEVWSATQCSLGREIAVKRLRDDLFDRASGADSHSAQQLESSFRLEGLTTARLEHPNIVPIHDLGFDEHGRPLLAMKLVRGKAWGEVLWADFKSLDVADFLARHLPVLIAVGNAVAFAHSRGVIHRDIKPGQVMLGEFGEVLLMDWGLAVAFDEEALRGISRATTPIIAQGLAEASNPAGTVAFMAPEQTEESGMNLGPWTDVFLLGGTLYFLLTGRPPYTGESGRQVFLKARHGAVLHPREAAAGREVPEELAAVAMRALSPDRTARQHSAAGFVMALQDYLSGASKRRESTAIAAQVEQALARGGCDYKLYGELVARLGNARALWPENPRLPSLREQVLAGYSRSALAYGDLMLARLQAERLDDGPRRADLLADIAAAEQAVSRHRRQRRVAIAAAFASLVLTVVAVTVFLLLQRETNARLESSNEELRLANERALRARSDAEGIVDFMVGSLRRKLGDVGRLDAMEEATLQALDYFGKLPAGEVTPAQRLAQARSLGSYADVLSATGRSVEARESYRKVLEQLRQLDAESPEKPAVTAQILNAETSIGWLAYQQGDTVAAFAHLGAAMETGAALAAREPGNMRHLREASIPVERLGMIRFIRNEHGEAARLFEQLLDMRQRILDSDPASNDSRKELTVALFYLGQCRKALGDREIALGNFLQAHALLTQVVEADPRNTRNRRDLSAYEISIGDAYRDLKRHAEAIPFYERSLSKRESLAAFEPRNTNWQSDLAVVLGRLGIVHRESGHPEAAVAPLTRSIGIGEQLQELEPANTSWVSVEVSDRLNLVDTLRDVGRFDEAHENGRVALAKADEVLVRSPGNAAFLRLRMLCLDRLGQVRTKEGRLEEAVAHFTEGLAAARAHHVATPSSSSAVAAVIDQSARLAEMLTDIGRGDEAAGHARAALDYLAEHLPNDTNAALLEDKAICLYFAGEHDAASQLYREVIALGHTPGARLARIAEENGWVEVAED